MKLSEALKLVTGIISRKYVIHAIHATQESAHGKDFPLFEGVVSHHSDGRKFTFGVSFSYDFLTDALNHPPAREYIAYQFDRLYSSLLERGGQ